MLVSTYKDGDTIVDRMVARDCEDVRLLGRGQDIQEFASSCDVLMMGTIPVLRTLGSQIGDVRRQGMSTLAGGLPAAELERPRPLEIHTREESAVLQDVVRARMRVQFELGRIGVLEPRMSVSYSLSIHEDRLIVRMLDPAVISRLWLDNVLLRADQWKPLGHSSYPSGPKRGFIDLRRPPYYFLELHSPRCWRLVQPGTRPPHAYKMAEGHM